MRVETRYRLMEGDRVIVNNLSKKEKKNYLKNLQHSELYIDITEVKYHRVYEY